MIDNDWELLQQYVQTRSEQAFAQIVRRHVDWVSSAARRQVGDEHLAEDVTQAVFIALARLAGRLHLGTALSTWLFQVTRYASIHAVRDETRRRNHEQRAASMMPESSTAIPEVQWDQLAPVLDELVEKLRKKDRLAVLLRFYQGKSFGEVGEVLGGSEEAARKRVGRAVEKLRGMLARKGVMAGTAAMGVVMADNVTMAAPAGVVETISAIAVSGGSGASVVLAKGVINTMWWIKMKIAAVITVVTLVVIGTGVSVAQRSTTVQPVAQRSTAVQPVAEPATTLADAAATQPSPELGGWTPEAHQCASHMRDVAVAIIVYSGNNGDLLPPDLGATLQYVNRNSDMTPKDRRNATAMEKAARYLCPVDQKMPVANPTRDWVNQNTSYVYLGGPDMKLSAIPKDKWGSTVILHDKLDKGHSHPKTGKMFVVVMLDGRAEGMTKDEAERAIAESKKTLEDAKNR